MIFIWKVKDSVFVAAADQGDSEVVLGEEVAEGDHEDGTCEWSACRAHQGTEVCKMGKDFLDI